MSKRILLVVTSADYMEGAPEKTGYWLEEAAAPYYVFSDAGYEVDIASPEGGNAPRDPRGMEAENQTEHTRRFALDTEATGKITNTRVLAACGSADYDAVYFAGGHGTMTDFPSDESVKHCVEQFYQSGKPVASVCHGPACLVGARNPQGKPIIDGHRFTCFTDSEEHAIGCEAIVPFLLETKLREQGGRAQTAEDFTAHVVSDGQLITGQNPPSSAGVAQAVLEKLQQSNAA